MSAGARSWGAQLLRVLRSPWVRGAFLAAAVGLAVYAVVAARDDLARAAEQLTAGRLLAALVASVVFVGCTFAAWRSVLADLGSPVPVRPALAVFGLSQLGKYVPGGVWNVVAAAEVGAGLGIPRRRSVTTTAVATLVGVVTGGVVGLVALPVVVAGSGADGGPGGGPGGVATVLWVLPAAVVVLAPPVANRLVARVLRAARREPLERPLTWRGLGAATAWSAGGWLCAGVQVWVLAVGLGMTPDVRGAALAVGGYALAWVVGFAVVVLPAGAGARELVLLAVLAGALPHAAVLLLVLVSRVLVTVADLGFAAAGGIARARR